MNTVSFESAEQYEAHDLLRLNGLPSTADLPAWLPGTFEQAPFAVVRRAEAPVGFVAVGFRGAARAHRYATCIARKAVDVALSPEQLRDRAVHAGRKHLKAFAALRALVQDRRFDSLIWGPTGSVGFELATAHPSVTDSSDLDILIRTPDPLTREQARALRRHFDGIEHDFGLRLDAQLDTPAGGVALSEWAEDKPRVMARSPRGPSLIADPWQSGHAPLAAHR